MISSFLLLFLSGCRAREFMIHEYIFFFAMEYIKGDFILTNEIV